MNTEVTMPVLMPLLFVLYGLLFAIVYLAPRDLGIYLGWLPAMVLIILAIVSDIWLLIFAAIAITIYSIAAVLRIDKSKRTKISQATKIKELEIMSIDDL